MKKIFALLLITVMLCAAIPSHATTEIKPNSMPNQKEYTILATLTPPEIDGTVSEDEYGEAIATYNYNDGLTRNGEVGNLTQEEMAEFVASDWTIYMTYDNDYIYFACTYVDTDFDTTADTAGYGVWNGDSLEIDFWKYTDNWEDYNIDDKSRCVIGMAADGTYWAGWANTGVPSYVPAPPHYPKSELAEGKDQYIVTRDGDNFTYEVKLTWEQIMGTDRPVDEMFFYTQLATDSSKYNNKNIGLGALFWWRNVIPFTAEESEAVDIAAGREIQKYAVPILHLEGREILPPLPEITTEPVTTEEPTTEAPTTDPAATDPATTETEATEPATTNKEETVTKAPETKAPETNAPQEQVKSGCGNSIELTALALVATLGTCTVFVAKKRDE